MDIGSCETRLPPTPPRPVEPAAFSPGTILADRYRIVALAGHGGMGDVYRADDLRLGQAVALKFLPPALEQDAAARNRLRAEVRAARCVSHPNVCRVHDLGEVAGRVFLTMEFIDGEDLASLLRRIGKLPAAKALDIARELCAGLAAAHDKGLLHRDLKPANVMIDGRGHARIMDFGLAVEATPAGSPADLAGTLAYMAPERFEGKPATVQSDLYALGLILFESCTGRLPFTAATARGWREAHVLSTPPSPRSLTPDLEPGVERAILRCLEKEPQRRPPSASHVASALPGGDPLAAAIAAGETPSPELVAASGEEGTLPRWKAWAWLAACIAALAVLPFVLAQFSLLEYVPFDRSPEELQVRAREIMERLGYTARPLDRAWWFRHDGDYLSHLDALRRSEALGELRGPVPGLLRFCYRESAARLVATGLSGAMTADDPVPATGDVYVELDLRGRLLTFRATLDSSGPASVAQGVDWRPLFDAGQLGSAENFESVEPRWWPPGGVDVRGARVGTFAGHRVRVEASARAGRTVAFRLELPWNSGKGSPASLHPTLAAALVVFWVTFAATGLLARRNMRLGREDRKGARRLSLTLAGAVGLQFLLLAHAPEVFLSNLTVAGVPFFAGVAIWLYYLGLEPSLRRAWPRLLVASSRLLDGGWRDPLVGRSLLVGVFAGLLITPNYYWPFAFTLDLPGGAPTLDPVSVTTALGPTSTYLSVPVIALVNGTGFPLLYLGLLLVMRLLLRRNNAAWLATLVVLLGWNCAALSAGGRWGTAVNALISSLLALWVLRYHGALALVIAGVVTVAASWTPWTLDLSRWYAWRQWLVVVLIVGLVVWGFRNVLGRQSAFPAGAIDG